MEWNFLQNELRIKLSFLLARYSPQDWICSGSLASLVTSYRSCGDGLGIFKWQQEERNTFHTSRRTVQCWDYKRIHHKFYWKKKKPFVGGKWQFCFAASYLLINDGMFDLVSHSVAASLSHLHCRRTTKKGREEQSNVLVIDMCSQSFDNFSALAVLSHHMSEVLTLKTVCRKS